MISLKKLGKYKNIVPVQALFTLLLVMILLYPATPGEAEALRQIAPIPCPEQQLPQDCWNCRPEVEAGDDPTLERCSDQECNWDQELGSYYCYKEVDYPPVEPIPCQEQQLPPECYNCVPSSQIQEGDQVCSQWPCDWTNWAPYEWEPWLCVQEEPATPTPATTTPTPATTTPTPDSAVTTTTVTTTNTTTGANITQGTVTTTPTPNLTQGTVTTTPTPNLTQGTVTTTPTPNLTQGTVTTTITRNDTLTDATTTTTTTTPALDILIVIMCGFIALALARKR